MRPCLKSVVKAKPGTINRQLLPIRTPLSGHPTHGETVLPLPQGEGRGEGEHNVTAPIVSLLLHLG